jgi:hypothetical protein
MFGVPKKTQDGRYYVKPNEPKLVQLNGVTVVSVSQDSVSLSLSEGAQKLVSDVDDTVLLSAKENCELWFSRVVAEKTLENAYTKSVSNGVVTATKSAHHKVYRVREAVGDADVTEGTVCDVVLELSGVSFTKKTYSPVWKIVQTRLKEPPKKKYHEEYLFQDDEDEPVSDDDLFA